MQVLEKATSWARARLPVASLAIVLVVAEATVLLSFLATIIVVNPSFMGWKALPFALVEHYVLLFVPLLVATACMVGFGIARARGVYPGRAFIVFVHLTVAILSHVQMILLLAKQEYGPSIPVFALYLAIFSLVLVSLLPGRDRHEVQGTGDKLVILVAVLSTVLIAGTVLVPAFLFMITSAVHLIAAISSWLAPARPELGEGEPGWFHRFTRRPVPRRLPARSSALGLLVLLEGILLCCAVVLAFERVDAFLGMTGSPDAIFVVLAGLLVHWSTLLGLLLVAIIEIVLPRVFPFTERIAGTTGRVALVILLLVSHAGFPVLSLACVGLLLYRMVTYLVSIKGVVRPFVSFIFLLFMVVGFAYVSVFSSQGYPPGVLELARGCLSIVVAVVVVLLVPIEAWWRRHLDA